MTTAPSMEAPARPWLWGGLFVLNMALIAMAQIFEVLEPPATWVLIVLNMGLIVPMARAARRRQEQKGAMSRALRTYNRRALTAMAAYMLAMIAGGNLHGRVAPDSMLLWLVALVPVLPLLAMIWTMYRYYHDESDEFLRHRAIVGALVGLIAVLVIGTVWGFLEMFELVPHVWNWWVFPVWAIGLGIGTCWPQDGGSNE